MRVIYEALVSKDERGDFCAAIPAFDVVTEGDGFADAVFMAHDLIQMLVSEYRSHLCPGKRWPAPLSKDWRCAPHHDGERARPFQCACCRWQSRA